VAGLVHVIDHPEGDDMVAMVGLPKATPGLSTPGEESWDVMGVRASGSWDTVYDNVFVPDAMMPAATHASTTFGSMNSFIPWFNITVSAVYLGVARAAVNWVTDYVKSRTPANEQRPLSHMAGIQYQLAEMIALNEASAALIRASAEDWMARPWDVEEAGSKGGICKYVATNNHVKVLNLAMDIAGGPGLFRRFGLERLYRDVRAGKAHPPSDVNALEQIAKHHLGTMRIA
jgi:alkylation response protein AidB-like acyl-CoA dehydrogenase